MCKRVAHFRRFDLPFNLVGFEDLSLRFVGILVQLQSQLCKKLTSDADSADSGETRVRNACVADESSDLSTDASELAVPLILRVNFVRVKW